MKSKIFIIIVTILISNSKCGAQMNNILSLIKVDGKNFVDENGNTIIFRGVSISDPDKLQKENMWSKNIFDELKKWNINIIRIPVHPSSWREQGEEKYLALMDEAIQWATDLGIYIIIDWHSIGNLRTELFQHPMYNTTKTETLRFWKTIAAKYIGNSTVAFYELFNEPTTYNGTLGKISWQQHKELMEEIIGIIYAHDTTKIPLVAGFNWAYELNEIEFEPIAFSNVAYVTHPYPQKREKPWEEKWEKDWGFAADRYPVIATELGFMSADGLGAHNPVIADEEYGERIIDYFNKKGISWVAWVFDPKWSPQLIENWDFEPTMQGKFFKKKMMELNK